MIFVIDVVFENFSHSVPALKGSYGSCKGRCLMRVLTLGHRIFPLNFRKNGFCQILTRRSWAPHFPCKFPYEVALVPVGWNRFRLSAADKPPKPATKKKEGKQGGSKRKAKKEIVAEDGGFRGQGRVKKEGECPSY